MEFLVVLLGIGLGVAFAQINKLNKAMAILVPGYNEKAKK